MMQTEPSCVLVIINYQTPDLTLRAFNSFHTFYPNFPVILVDNGSRDNSQSLLTELQQKHPDQISVIHLPKNIHHGPAMHTMLHHGDSKYVFFLDSECEVFREGFIEQMLELAKREEKVLAVGKKIFMNKRGFDVEESADTIPYIRPFCMLVHRRNYQLLPPFQKHGSPCLQTMREAGKKNFSLLHFPVLEYVQHTGRGTVNRFGYQLGMRDKFNYLLHRLGV
ncbi:MAG: glycosyltransferase family 2 protein [Ignavibacteriae bacterium]|nr:glycosyltransferase family 2 protein [Ignavibacteriota bacterium]